MSQYKVSPNCVGGQKIQIQDKLQSLNGNGDRWFLGLGL